MVTVIVFFILFYYCLYFSLADEEEDFKRENVALHMVHHACRTSKLIVPKGEHGIGVYFKMNESFPSLSDLSYGSDVFGSVMIDKRPIFEDIDITSGMYAVCAINCILKLEYKLEHEDFLVYLEKEFLGISRSYHTALTTSLKKDVMKVPVVRKKKQFISLSTANDGLLECEVVTSNGHLDDEAP